MSLDRLTSLINSFNANANRYGLNGYLNLIQCGIKFKLVMGRLEQFEYNTYQCELCEGTINDCYKVAQAVRLAVNIECGIY